MTWDVEFTDEFDEWWSVLTENEQVSIDASVRLLEQRGPALGFPHSSGIERSKHPHLRELRIQHDGRPYRVLYAFDPRRTAILLIGGDKTGNDRWYERKRAESRYVVRRTSGRIEKGRVDRWQKSSLICARA